MENLISKLGSIKVDEILPIKPQKSKGLKEPLSLFVTEIGGTGDITINSIGAHDLHIDTVGKKKNVEKERYLRLHDHLYSLPYPDAENYAQNDEDGWLLDTTEEELLLWPLESRECPPSPLLHPHRLLHPLTPTHNPQHTTLHHNALTGTLTQATVLASDPLPADPANSMLLSRAMGDSAIFASGSTEHYPFLPGGLQREKERNGQRVRGIPEEEEAKIDEEAYTIMNIDQLSRDGVRLNIHGNESSHCQLSVNEQGDFIVQNLMAKLNKGKEPKREEMESVFSVDKDVGFDVEIAEGDDVEYYYKHLSKERGTSYRELNRRDKTTALVKAYLAEQNAGKGEDEEGEEGTSDSEYEYEYEIVEEYVFTSDEEAEDIEEVVEVVEIIEGEEETSESVSLKVEKEEVSARRKRKPRKWAAKEERNMYNFHDLVPNMVIEYPFELDEFQKEAIYHLQRGESVFVAAHTSAGKTVVAEYAIALALKHLTRVVYTSPIKALSNQKFRDFKDVFNDVGLITGDVSVSPEAPCLVVTTEILRSMLYKGADLIRDIEWVIFDEIHYINDTERGVVWEEVIIMLPDHISLIFLSATVPNTVEFAEWVGRTKRKVIYISSTPFRPVPLEHYLYANDDLHKIVDKKSSFLTQGYKNAANSFIVTKKEKQKQKQKRVGARSMGRGSYTKLVKYLQTHTLLPAVVFVFSKKRAAELAYSLSSTDLNTAVEKGEVHVFVESSLSRLKGSDKNLPQVLAMKDLLKRGIGVHHGGLLPIMKEIVELLFSRGLVKILFATETFAMGVNMPARTVIFHQTDKHDGETRRELTSGEYTQMSGRAGRRGMDSTGVVIIVCWNEVPEPGSLRRMLLGESTTLSSQFRLTYNMILNLFRLSGEFRVEDMMKRSFSESVNQKVIEHQRDRYRDLERKVEDMEELHCILDPTLDSLPMDTYYHLHQEEQRLYNDIQDYLIEHGYLQPFLTPGRVVVVQKQSNKQEVGILLRKERSSVSSLAYFTNSDTGAGKYLVLTLTHIPSKEISRTFTIASHSITQISRVCVVKIKVDEVSIIDRKNENEQRRVVGELQRLLLNTAPLLPKALDPIHDIKIKSMDFRTLLEQYRTHKHSLTLSPCHTCLHLKTQYVAYDQQQRLRVDLQQLQYLMSEDSLTLKPEFEQRVMVLQRLHYVEGDGRGKGVVQLKGMVAREVSTVNELIATELIFENLLTPLSPPEAAALVSALVFQQKSDISPKIESPMLSEAIKTLEKIATSLAHIQIACGLILTPSEYLTENLNTKLVEVVYEWARGMTFAEICALTDVQEGTVVRTIVRLDETLRDFKNAARIVGDPSLALKMDQCRQLIKRDIVFTSSLYVS